MALRDWLQLAMTDGIGPILAGRLLTAAGSAQRACAADSRLLEQIDGIGPARARRVQSALRESAGLAEAELLRCATAGVRLICREDGEYPAMLAAIPDPPLVLFMRGSLEPRDLNAMAVVGSRRCSHYGREQAERFGTLLGGAGFTVVSGGARGIDSAAHRGAMQHPLGRTIAVLGCGVDVAYPPENAVLFDQIATRGAVISEFPLSSPPLKDNFPRRNRIVSGLSRGVLVIEADTRSGALITARQAGDEHGRPVFALPGRVDNPMSAGAHELIRDGATLVTGLAHIVEGLGPLPDGVATPSNVPDVGGQIAAAPESSAPELPFSVATHPTATKPMLLTDTQRQILDAIGPDGADVDRIIEASGLEASQVLQDLTLLSLRAAVRREDGQTYHRRR